MPCGLYLRIVSTFFLHITYSRILGNSQLLTSHTDLTDLADFGAIQRPIVHGQSYAYPLLCAAAAADGAS